MKVIKTVYIQNHHRKHTFFVHTNYFLVASCCVYAVSG